MRRTLARWRSGATSAASGPRGDGSRRRDRRRRGEALEPGGARALGVVADERVLLARPVPREDRVVVREDRERQRARAGGDAVHPAPELVAEEADRAAAEREGLRRHASRRRARTPRSRGADRRRTGAPSLRTAAPSASMRSTARGRQPSSTSGRAGSGTLTRNAPGSAASAASTCRGSRRSASGTTRIARIVWAVPGVVKDGRPADFEYFGACVPGCDRLASAPVNAAVGLLGRVLRSTFHMRAQIPPEHPSARLLGTERMGSGAVIDAGGLILTVNYVVLGAEEVTVTLLDQREYVAEVVRHDFHSGLALLRIAERGLPGAAAPPLGRSDARRRASSSSRASARARRASRTAPSATSARSTPTGSTSSSARS